MRSTEEWLADAEDGGSSTASAVGRAATATKGQVVPVAYTRERTVEHYFKVQAKKRSDRCMTEKHESPGRRGVPDQLITWGHPLALMELVEMKAPKGERAKHQVRDHKARAKLGIKVHTLYTIAEVDDYFRTMDHLMSLT